MEIILEIVKITIPAVIVFLTVYVLMKYHYRKVYSIEVLKTRNENINTTLPLKLQAYERLALFCERISPQSLIFRLKKDSVSAEDLKNLMILTIKQEFDHNITQQIYVSDSLWDIVTIGKNQLIEIISSSRKAQKTEDVEEFLNILLTVLDEKNPIDTTLKAIRKEVELFFNY